MLKENEGRITEELMMEFLREHDVGICMHGMFQSTSSQVSILRQDGKRSTHWFTGSTLPCLSVFKPYTFPIKRENLLGPGPYDKIHPNWFWTKHNEYVKNFKRKSAADKKAAFIAKSRKIEKKAIERVRNLGKIEEEIPEKQYLDQFYAISNESWKESQKLIE